MLKIKKKKKEVDTDYYLELERRFKPIDKFIQLFLGKPCKEFAPKCACCKGWLIYNKFKEDFFEEFT